MAAQAPQQGNALVQQPARTRRSAPHHAGQVHAEPPDLALGLPVQGPNLVNDCVWLTFPDGSTTLSVSKEFLSMVPYCSNEMLKGFGGSKHSPCVLPRQLTLETLHTIINYVEFHSQPGRSDKERKQYDEKLVKMDTKRLCELTSAADSLEMRPLVDITSRGLARLIEGKSPEEIREAFNLPDDLTEEEKLEPVKNLINDPRIRLLNRLYAKKRKELYSKKIEAKKASEEQGKQQDSRPLDELLSFIETKPSNGDARVLESPSSKESKGKKGGKQRAKSKGNSRESSSNGSHPAAAAGKAGDAAGKEDSTAPQPLSNGSGSCAGNQPAAKQMNQQQHEGTHEDDQQQQQLQQASNSPASGPSPATKSSISSRKGKRQQQQQGSSSNASQPGKQEQAHFVLLPPEEPTGAVPQQQRRQPEADTPSMHARQQEAKHALPDTCRRITSQQRDAVSSADAVQEGSTQHAHQPSAPSASTQQLRGSSGACDSIPGIQGGCSSQAQGSGSSLSGAAGVHSGMAAPWAPKASSPAANQTPERLEGLGCCEEQRGAYAAGCAQWEERMQELLFNRAGCGRSSRLPALPVLEDGDGDDGIDSEIASTFVPQ